MDFERLRELLAQHIDESKVRLDEDMSLHISFKAGGKASLFVEVNNTEELQYVLYMLGSEAGCGGRDGCCRGKEDCDDGGGGCCIITDRDESSCHVADCDGESYGTGRIPSDEAGQPVKFEILGNGSNILVTDKGYKGVVIKMGEGFDYVRVDGNRVIAGAGALLSVTAKAAAEASLAGFEFASGIPGSIGGAVFMNAGAYGGEIKDIIVGVKAVSRDGARSFLADKEELELGYRHSILHDSGDIVTEAVFELEPGDKEEIKEKMRKLAVGRNSKQPVQLPSAGSFFKRPDGYFAGKLIEDSGCKGLSVGGAQVSPMHAGFIVNTGGATASDIIALMKLVQNTVFDATGVMLEPEVRIIGE